MTGSTFRIFEPGPPPYGCPVADRLLIRLAALLIAVVTRRHPFRPRITPQTETMPVWRTPDGKGCTGHEPFTIGWWLHELAPPAAMAAWWKLNTDSVWGGYGTSGLSGQVRQCLTEWPAGKDGTE